MPGHRTVKSSLSRWNARPDGKPRTTRQITSIDTDVDPGHYKPPKRLRGVILPGMPRFIPHEFGACRRLACAAQPVLVEWGGSWSAGLAATPGR